MSRSRTDADPEPSMAQTEERLGPADYESLAAFRLALRRFLAFSEEGARRAGLTPQQHQALLVVRGGRAEGEEISIGDLAEQLLLKHHSAVGLVARMTKAGLIVGVRSQEDRRRVLLRLTARGREVLDQVSAHNIPELRRAARSFVEFVGRLESGRS